MKTIVYLSAVALLAVGMASGAFAQSQEPDCPEDFDTEPGCDMSPMDDGTLELDTSERQPVPGAATAPTAPDPVETEGDKSLASPEATDPVESEAAEASEGDAAASDNGSSGGSETVEVMARGVKFAPAIIFIQPGDTVSWTNMASHNVETLEGMVPEGQDKIATEIGENVSRTFDTTGIIVYKCTPHWGNRMGGVIVVGDPENPMEIIDAYMQSANENTENLPALGLLKDLRAEMESRG